MRHRFLNKIYANRMGYFWLPCPLCGEMFGGHETYWSLEVTQNSENGVCPDCKEEAIRLNREKPWNEHLRPMPHYIEFRCKLCGYITFGGFKHCPWCGEPY